MKKGIRKKLTPATTIVLGFLTVILIGTFFLCLPISSANHKWLSFIDSFFTSTSAVCVTGLTVVDTSIYFSLFGQIVIMILIQIGGLGFITLTSMIFLLLGKKLTYGNRVAIQESYSQENNQGIVKFLKRIIIFVFSAELIGFIALAPSMIIRYGWGNGIFRALFLSVSAFCNAGFNVTNNTTQEFQSISAYSQNSLILIPIMLLIVVGGIGFVVVFDIGNKFTRHRKKMSFHSKLVLCITGVLIFAPAILFAIFEWNNPATIGNLGVWDKIVNSLFQSVTPRTAGFATFDMARLSPQSKILTDVLMLIGGSPVSTAGGIKTTTLFIALLAVFKRSNSKGDVVFMKKQVSNKLIRKSMRIISIALILTFTCTFLILICEGGAFGIDQVIFEVISALSTVGLSLGITPLLGIVSKLLLILLMFVGRVGALTLSVAFVGKQKPLNEDIEYPDSKIIIG